MNFVFSGSKVWFIRDYQDLNSCLDIFPSPFLSKIFHAFLILKKRSQIKRLSDNLNNFFDTFSSQWWSHSGSTLSNCLNMFEFWNKHCNICEWCPVSLFIVNNFATSLGFSFEGVLLMYFVFVLEARNISEALSLQQIGNVKMKGTVNTLMWKIKSFFESSLLLFARSSTCPISSLDSWKKKKESKQEAISDKNLYPVVFCNSKVFLDGDLPIVGCVGLVTQIHQS